MRAFPRIARIAAMATAVLLLCVLIGVRADFNVPFIFSGYMRGAYFHVVDGRADCDATNTPLSTSPLCIGGCHRRAAFINSKRTAFPGALLLDSGGSFWGSIYHTVYGPAPMADCMGTAQYDVIALDGSDFYNSVNDVTSFIDRVKDLSPNTVFTATNVDFSGLDGTNGTPNLASRVAKYTVLTYNGVRVGVMSGVASYYQSNSQVPTAFRIAQDQSTADSIRLAIYAMRQLSPPVQVFAVMLDNNSEWPDMSMSLQIEGLSIVFRPRTEGLTSYAPVAHTNIYGQTVFEVPLRERGLQMAFFNAQFDSNGHLKVAETLAASDTLLLTTSSYDATVWTYMTTNYDLSANPDFNQVIAKTAHYTYGDTGPTLPNIGPSVDGCPAPIGTGPCFGCRSAPCPIGQAVVDSMLYACPDCNIAFLNGGAVRASLPGSPASTNMNISVRDANTVLPFFNALGMVRVLGSTVIKSIAWGVQKVGQGSFLLHNLRYVYNVNQTVVDPPLTQADRVMNVNIYNAASQSWVAIDPNAVYKVVSNAYLLAGGDGHNFTSVDGAGVWADLGVSQTNAFIEYLGDKFPPNGTAMNYQTLAQVSACSSMTEHNNALWPSDCLMAWTNLLRPAYDSCATNKNVCEATQNTFLFEGVYVGANCDECSGLGTCVNHVCQCSLSGTSADGVPYSFTDGVPSSGFWANYRMISGSDCSTVRSIWELGDGEKAAMYVASALAFSVSLAWMILLLAFRKRPVIRATSPLHCALMCIGAIVGACGIVVDAESVKRDLCNASIWLYLIGYSILFSCMFVKTHRIHTIFNSKLLKRRASYTDLKVLVFVGLIVLAEVIILIIFRTVAPLKPGPVELDDSTVAILCTANTPAFTGILIVFNALLMLWGVYLAVRTRNVDSNFNESKYIGMAAYNCAVCCLIILLVMYVLLDIQPTVAIMIKAWLVCYIIICTLTVMFLPRFLLVYRGVETVNEGTTRQNSSIELERQAARDKRNIQQLVQKMKDRDTLIQERDAALALFKTKLLEAGIDLPDVQLRSLAELEALAMSSAATSNLGGNTTGAGVGGNGAISPSSSRVGAVAISPSSSRGGASADGHGSAAAVPSEAPVKRPMFANRMDMAGRGKTRGASPSMASPSSAASSASSSSSSSSSTVLKRPVSPLALDDGEAIPPPPPYEATEPDGVSLEMSKYAPSVPPSTEGVSLVSSPVSSGRSPGYKLPSAAEEDTRE